VEADPAKLLAYGIPISRVVEAARASNQYVGGRVLEMGGTEYVVRGRGRLGSAEDIRGVAVGTGAGGSPITVGDVDRAGGAGDPARDLGPGRPRRGGHPPKDRSQAGADNSFVALGDSLSQ
jgi:Cu(I)/Ag(I) efflux system membrane protein CusA/SilA